MKLMFSEKSKWIGLDDELRLPVRVQSPAMQLRRSFFYSGAEQAECLICGLGAYILYINGKRVNNDVLSPAFTAYDIRTLYMHYDVTAYLQKGENVIAVKLGDGFYNQTTEDNWGYHAAPWRNTPRLRFELFADDAPNPRMRGLAAGCCLAIKERLYIRFRAKYRRICRAAYAWQGRANGDLSLCGTAGRSRDRPNRCVDIRQNRLLPAGPIHLPRCGCGGVAT